MSLITVFTPTYNRGYIIGKLFETLKQQSCFDFEWLVIDDGSYDNTESLFKEQYLKEEIPFSINYVKTINRGKILAIEKALELAKGKYFFIVDSDDYLLPNAIENMKKWIADIDSIDDIVGVGAARAYPDMSYIKGVEPTINDSLGYLDATNLERAKYNLDADMCEAYKTDILRKYTFKVWKGEKFTPESVYFNEIALDGYKVRWHKEIVYICEYLADGLTKGSDRLIKNNPMGYAMMYDHILKYGHGLKKNVFYCIQMNALAIYAKNYMYCLESNNVLLGLITWPIGYLLSLRRSRQFKNLQRKR